jgi:hypothetical protein
MMHMNKQLQCLLNKWQDRIRKSHSYSSNPNKVWTPPTFFLLPASASPTPLRSPPPQLLSGIRLPSSPASQLRLAAHRQSIPPPTPTPESDSRQGGIQRGGGHVIDRWHDRSHGRVSDKISISVLCQSKKGENQQSFFCSVS